MCAHTTFCLQMAAVQFGRCSSRISATFNKYAHLKQFTRTVSTVKQAYTAQRFRQWSVGLAPRSYTSSRCFSIPQYRNFATSTPSTVTPPSLLRNVAIIAHVDHGKTTLVDALLKYGGMQIAHDRFLDHNELEKERGITILSKVTKLDWEGYQFNIVDTPGHADFGGEVERVLSMVDGVCLIVDAVEGPKTQTKFVLQKALWNPKCKLLVIINKMDRTNIRKQGECENEIFDLFLSLGATDEQMEYLTLYASGRNGWCVRNFEEVRQDPHKEGVIPILRGIRDYIDPPSADTSSEFSMLTTLLENQENVGVVATGKIYSGTVTKGDTVYILDRHGKLRGNTAVKGLYVTKGTTRHEVTSSGGGDIVSMTFLKGITPLVTDTIASVQTVQPISSRPIDPPTICVSLSPNTSPLVGQDGIYITLGHIGKRLKKEALSNVAIDVVESENKDSYEVRGRGELQIGILLETMRREGYEMSVSPPSVILKKDESGKTLEPWEEFQLDIPIDAAAPIMEKLSNRQAEIVDMKTFADTMQLKFHCSSNNFLGLRTYIRDVTKGTGTLMSELLDYRPLAPRIKLDRNSLIISSSPGVTTLYSLESLQQKGQLFVGDGIPTYEGMILAEHNGPKDLEMNAVKVKPVVNVRAKGHEESIRLNVKQMTIENCLSFILPDEQLEVTPKRICMRKKILSYEGRKAMNKSGK